MKIWQKKGTKVRDHIDQFTVGDDRQWDLRLAPYDIIASQAHAKMLGKVGLLSQSEVDQLIEGLTALSTEVKEGRFTISDDFEDVHSKIEYELTKTYGDVGKKIHTARSRNDQVLVAMQLFLKDEIQEIKQLVKALFEQYMTLADRYKDQLLPGYTHLQIAMPSSFGLWFSAYAEILSDEVLLLNTVHALCDQNPLGSAAGYGSSFPIDRQDTTATLGFDTLKYNVVAAQMSRGKLEKNLAQAIGSLAGTLSRFSMDVCLYMSQNFDFISFPDDITTGSSIMPHKKNPDVFELIRGKCNKLQALPNELAMMSTNLPSGYHREMQLFKGPIMQAIDEIKSCLSMTTSSIAEVLVKQDILSDEKYTHVFSVDALHELIQQGVPFRDAYVQIGEAINKEEFVPPKMAKHTHSGSIGNLELGAIREKFTKYFEK
ncbi:MAG: argininosuccinate lyase [Flavobacteriaceae bacterium]|nr:argininosuccinate lyase [Flavobacteriaceae bacterium]|tara:strand:+ start:12743 stop:14032 length:1290 start_codon:yes stop_codon:yes gene_type:complete